MRCICVAVIASGIPCNTLHITSSMFPHTRLRWECIRKHFFKKVGVFPDITRESNAYPIILCLCLQKNFGKHWENLEKSRGMECTKVTSFSLLRA